LGKTLKEFITYFGASRQCAVSRELSKIHEENFRGTIEEAVNHFNQKEIRGEIVIILAGVD